MASQREFPGQVHEKCDSFQPPIRESGAYSVFYIIERNEILVSKPPGNFEESLLNHNFMRVHKSHIINLGQIVKYVRGEGGYVVMSNKKTIPVSRQKKDEFLNAIGSL